MSYLKVRNLTKSFGRLKAVDGIDLDLEKGNTVAIFGGNGAGKTTLLKIISTLMRPSSGTVRIGDAEDGRNADSVRRTIGFISHSLFLYKDLNAVENLRYFGKLYGVRSLEDRISKLLTDFGLLPRMYDPVMTYSRGMLQRLALARALIHDPELLLLDEPFTGLDRSAAAILTVYIERHKSEGGATILVTHDLENGYSVADELAVLTNGELLWRKNPVDISLEEFKKVYSDLVNEGVK